MDDISLSDVKGRRFRRRDLTLRRDRRASPVGGARAACWLKASFVVGLGLLEL
jgi:hypothetical protein